MRARTHEGTDSGVKHKLFHSQNETHIGRINTKLKFSRVHTGNFYGRANSSCAAGRENTGSAMPVMASVPISNLHVFFVYVIGTCCSHDLRNNAARDTSRGNCT